MQYPTAASETESTRTTPDKQEKYACAHDKGAILLDKTEPHRKASRMFDWSVLASVASLTRGHCGKFHGFVFGVLAIRRAPTKTRGDLEAKRLNDPELVKVSAIFHRRSRRVTPNSVWVGLAGAISGAYQRHRAQVPIAAQQQDTHETKMLPKWL